MSILELHDHGIFEYLFRKGLLSGSTLAYFDYYNRFEEERISGTGYRESIRKLALEYRVSETTIKKAVRIVQDKKV